MAELDKVQKRILKLVAERAEESNDTFVTVSLEELADIDDKTPVEETITGLVAANLLFVPANRPLGDELGFALALSPDGEVAVAGLSTHKKTAEKVEEAPAPVESPKVAAEPVKKEAVKEEPAKKEVVKSEPAKSAPSKEKEDDKTEEAKKK